MSIKYFEIQSSLEENKFNKNCQIFYEKGSSPHMFDYSHSPNVLGKLINVNLA